MTYDYEKLFLVLAYIFAALTVLSSGISPIMGTSVLAMISCAVLVPFYIFCATKTKRTQRVLYVLREEW